MKFHSRIFFVGFLVLVLALVADQLSKWAMLNLVHIGQRPAIELTSFFNLVMVWNTGMSFGMLAGIASPTFFIILTVSIFALLFIWLFCAAKKTTAFALGLVMGGALGNLVDRLRLGAVADFFDFHMLGYHWPAFNLADAFIFIGVVVLCLEGMLSPAHKQHKDEP